MKNEVGFTLSVYKQMSLNDGASIGLGRYWVLTAQPNLRAVKCQQHLFI